MVIAALDRTEKQIVRIVRNESDPLSGLGQERDSDD